ncbi:type II toxin-antitoxin system RelE/ParE family toxin [Nocardia sp. NPDC050713]|uniref:type II toxin-antitoxin system RelE/ParE family toxin n=1 Tax=Nocardia sp. NPDC050713 TaxID=3154511 RepID=UPI0033CB0F56
MRRIRSKPPPRHPTPVTPATRSAPVTANSRPRPPIVIRYRIDADADLEVIRILHQRMDVGSHL